MSSYRALALLAAFALGGGIILSPLTGHAQTGAAAKTTNKSPESGAVLKGGRVLKVGPSRALKAPSAAASIARDGDTVEIDAGTYLDCAVWRQNRLRLRGVNGVAHVKDISCQGKAIWVIYGRSTRVENIRFSRARVAHRNGAGIRFEGGQLVVVNSHFHNNQVGILTHNKRRTSLLVANSSFVQNGDCPSFCGHGIYAGRITKLRVVNSTFRAHRFGHHIKSRALYNEIIGNRITDGATGNASFAIDIPNSGTAIIQRNYIEQGPKADNHRGVIAIGEEGVSNPSRGLVIKNNAFWNRHARGTNFVWNRSHHPVKLVGNSFRGGGQKLRGPGRVY